jgi:hypothetical protein
MPLRRSWVACCCVAEPHRLRPGTIQRPAHTLQPSIAWSPYTQSDSGGNDGGGIPYPRISARLLTLLSGMRYNT